MDRGLGSTPLSTVINGVASINTEVASKFLMGKTRTVSFILSITVLVVAVQLITAALLVLKLLWINFLVGQCISCCFNRPGILALA